MNRVRERNESAWLLPAGPGSNPRLREDMRQYGETSANPALTIMALAARAARVLVQGARSGALMSAKED